MSLETREIFPRFVSVSFSLFFFFGFCFLNGQRKVYLEVTRRFRMGFSESDTKLPIVVAVCISYIPHPSVTAVCGMLSLD